MNCVAPNPNYGLHKIITEVHEWAPSPHGGAWAYCPRCRASKCVLGGWPEYYRDGQTLENTGLLISEPPCLPEATEPCTTATGYLPVPNPKLAAARKCINRLALRYGADPDLVSALDAVVDALEENHLSSAHP